MAKHSAGDDDDDVNWNTDDEIDNYQSSPSPASVDYMSETSVQPAGSTNVVHVGISDETVARFIEMGFSIEMIGRAIKETGGENPEPMMILETLFKISTSSEASSSNSKVIDQLTSMGFSEELVIKVIQEHGEENLEEITNALLSYAEAEKMHETEDEDVNNNYSGLSSSDEENELNSFHEDGRLQALIEMDYPREEASIALERCGENESLSDVIDFISVARLARQFDEFWSDPDDKEPIINEPPPRRRKLNTAMVSDDELIRLPNPMIGFGVPKKPWLMTERPDPIPDIARGPPYFYYENVAMAPKGVWAKISMHLYDIKPEFVDSIYFCAAARKRGYIHNLPIKNRFEIQPPPHYTIQEEFPLTKKWWPVWDKRTKLNCVLTCIGSVQPTKEIHKLLEKHGSDPDVQKDVLDRCKKWNLVWIGKNRAAPLEPDEMERLLGFPVNHTRGISRTDRYRSLGNSFQVDTVAYHLSVLKPLYPKGINVLSLFTGIGGGEVALHRLQIPMNLVVSVEISEVNRNIFRSFWDQTSQKGDLIEFRDVKELDDHKIERLMDRYGGLDLVIGGSPCNNLAGGNRIEDFKIKVFDKLSSKAEKVLEIGIGTGPNMRYYAARNVNVTLLGLDPNPKMKKYARKAAAKAGLKPKSFRFKEGVGEAIPLDNASVDAVVATLVLCSVSDVTQTLNEIKRVLRPGGIFIFLEHVAAKDGSLFRRLQKLLDPLQQKFADGCHLTRNTRECILEAGFSGGVEIETMSTRSFPWITRPHIYGVAYK